jgi:magnesium chelatase subunit D
LAGRIAVSEDDAALAARLVLAPRACVLPEDSDQTQQDEPQPRDNDGNADDATAAHSDRPLEDMVLDAVKAAIPQDLLSELRLGNGGLARPKSSSKSGALLHSVKHGRPKGARQGGWRAGARLHVIETLRAAAPWQVLRRKGKPLSPDDGKSVRRIELRRDDFRIRRFDQRRETTAIFVVDASGSSALQRLAEAKGAVELLLAKCYVRRDQVALVSFRNKAAELLLPPTRSLVRAKRSLAALPGGGGTPLATGIDAAFTLADAIKRKGQTPIVILLTDGRANVARDGAGGRERANEDALTSAKALRAAGITALLLDTSPQPQETSRNIATAMGARYLPLPHANSAELSHAVLASMPVH